MQHQQQQQQQSHLESIAVDVLSSLSAKQNTISSLSSSSTSSSSSSKLSKTASISKKRPRETLEVTSQKQTKKMNEWFANFFFWLFSLSLPQQTKKYIKMEYQLTIFRRNLHSKL